jgi:hypothetical protein
MRTVEFLRRLDSDNVLRVRFDVDRGRVQGFVVQLECLFDEVWQPVVRYDTHHGFAHRDLLHPSGEADKTDLQEPDRNKALNLAVDDLVTNWHNYRKRYEQWLQRRKAK